MNIISHANQFKKKIILIFYKKHYIFIHIYTRVGVYAVLLCFQIIRVGVYS